MMTGVLVSAYRYRKSLYDSVALETLSTCSMVNIQCGLHELDLPTCSFIQHHKRNDIHVQNKKSTNCIQYLLKKQDYNDV